MKNRENLFKKEHAGEIGGGIFRSLLKNGEEVSASFKEYVKENISDKLISAILMEIDELLKNFQSAEKKYYQFPKFELVNTKNVPFQAFFYAIANEIYINEYPFKALHKKIEKGEWNEFELLVVIIHLVIHEILHSKSNNEIYFVEKTDGQKSHLYLGFQFSSVVVTSDGFLKSSKARYLALNEGMTDLLAYLILFRILKKKTVDFGFGKKYPIERIQRDMNDETIYTTYFPYMFILIQMFKKFAKNNKVNDERIVFFAFVEHYFYKGRIDDPQLISELKSSFDTVGMFNDFKKILVTGENRTARDFMKKYYGEVNSTEIKNKVLEFLESLIDK